VQTNKQTDRQTRLNAVPMPAAIQPAWVNGKQVVGNNMKAP